MDLLDAGRPKHDPDWAALRDMKEFAALVS
jgi:hypothetical protein